MNWLTLPHSSHCCLQRFNSKYKNANIPPLFTFPTINIEPVINLFVFSLLNNIQKTVSGTETADHFLDCLFCCFPWNAGFELFPEWENKRCIDDTLNSLYFSLFKTTRMNKLSTLALFSKMKQAKSCHCLANSLEHMQPANQASQW